LKKVGFGLVECAWAEPPRAILVAARAAR